MYSWNGRIAAAACHLLVWCYLCTAQEVAQVTAQSQPAPLSAATSDVKPSPPSTAVGAIGGFPATPPGTAVSQEPPSLRVEETRPAIYYLPDKQGNLQPVLDFSYQDFVDLYRLKNQLGRRDQPPRYSLTQMSAIGVAGAEHAELTVRCQVQVRDGDWVRVPLRLDRGVLRGEVQYRGSGEQFVQFDSQGDGYVCWIRGKPDTSHEITLSMLVPLTVIGEETRLSLWTPRATASELKLTVPMQGISARVSDGSTLLRAVEQDKENTKATELTVVGLGGDFQLAWHKANPNAVEPPVVLESVGSVLTRFNGHSITSEATLSVRGFGAAFDRLVVRLPPSAALSAGKAAASGYVVSPIEAKDRSAGESRLVEVRLAKKTLGPVDVRIACERTYDPTANQAWCELGGFEVIDAARQWGSIAVATSSDWQVIWGASGNPRQVDQIPESLRRDDVIACFEYDAQPFSLAARLVPRRTRINVAPEYVLLVDRDRVRLEGKLKYSIRGAKVVSVKAALPGWELDEIGPDSVVAVDGVATDPAGLMTIPLVQPYSGEIVLTLTAHRVIPSGATSLTVPLPQPQGDSASPAVVAVVPADNVELLPNSAAMEGLVRQRTEPPMKLPDRQQESLFYRGLGAASLFAADLRFHSQRITVDVNSALAIEEHAVVVEQKFVYTVAYEPADRLTIDVPRGLAKADRLKLLVDGKPLSSAIDASQHVERAAASIPLRVMLPQPRIGRCEVVVRYTEPLGSPATDLTTVAAVPLTMPGDGEVANNHVFVKTRPNVQATLQKGPWKAAENEDDLAADRGGIWLTAVGRAAEIVFDVRREESANADATFVDRAWVQSWLNASVRQDRAVYQFVTSRKDLEVTLPIGVLMSQTSMVLDGQPVECRSLSENRWLIPLGGNGESSRYVLEMRYHFADPQPIRGLLTMEFPRLGTDAWIRRLYWQLALPPNEHVVASPEGFVGEYHWDWHGYFWGRRPLLDQAQLESWVGATPRAPLPEGSCLYLYSAMGNADRAELHTAGRSWIVLWSSGGVLVLGLLLIYVPFIRHPAALLTMALGLISAGVIAPEPTFLVAQAASLGLVLTLLAGLLDRRAVSGPMVMPAVVEPANASVETGANPTSYHPPVVGNPSSTQTMQPIAPPDTRDAET